MKVIIKCTAEEKKQLCINHCPWAFNSEIKPKNCFSDGESLREKCPKCWESSVTFEIVEKEGGEQE